MLNRFQQAYVDFTQASETFLKYVDFRDAPSLLDFYQNLIEATAAFGNCEISARENERAQMLNIKTGDRSQKMMLSDNEKGLAFLSHAKAALEPLKEELKQVPKIEVSKKDIKISLEELAEAMVEADIKPSDVEKIQAAFRGNLEELSKKGIHYLPEYLEQKVEELEKIRREPERGAVENIPLWKIIIIVIIVGVWLWAYVVCNWRGRCRLRDSLPHQMMTWILSLIAKYC